MNNWLVRTDCRTVPNGYDFAVDVIGEESVKQLTYLATGESKSDAFNDVADTVGEDAVVEIFDLGPVDDGDAFVENMSAVSRMLTI